MVNRRISADLKEAALRMWEHGWELSDICSALIVSARSMYRWHAIFNKLRRVTRPPSGLRGRPQIISLLALDACHKIYAENNDTYLTELQWFLAVHHDIVISISALQATLQKDGLTRKLLHKIAAERDHQPRADHYAAIQNPLLFSGTGLGQHADFKDVFIRGVRYSLVAAMSMKGYIATRGIEGSYDAPLEYFSFIVDEVVPQMNAYPDENSVLLMDNCRIHHTKSSRDVLNQQGIYFSPSVSTQLYNPFQVS
ncbi:hypothetical protein K435DRAFT_675230 [Dendrothele bispora CBS 962.96]|uniref:Tc1-like transposase DDE domain-containing protein n=1 Tax=Dendrothele bispora (strain CBS 962.96) TaxID=1314807 RepID=A0A4S8LPG3_DENBC|nr:hypothetical protein K435DRAFT_675230 [Dendrothele bispora CBS 962.96]